MKKLLIVILSLIACACLAVGFVGCGGNTNGNKDDKDHVHTYSTEWTVDETYHWKKATCEHKDEISEKGTHRYYNNKCVVCGYDVSERTDMFAQVDFDTILQAFADNAYTVKATANDSEIQFAVSLKDLYAKIKVDGDRALLDLTGIYFADGEELHYASIKAVFENIFFNMTDMPFDAFIEMINEHLPEGWTVADVVSIFYSDGEFKFDILKANAFIETFFNEGITVGDVMVMSLDGFDYKDITTIFPAETIAMIEESLPEGWTVERAVAMIKNITPERIITLVNAIKAGELTKEQINAILPDDYTTDMLDEFLPEGITVDKIIETINTVVNYIKEIDFEKLAEEIKAAQVAFTNGAIDALFIKEIVDGNVKYTLNYGLIKEINNYLNDTTLETIINSVLGAGFVDSASAYSVVLIDTKLCDLKAMIDAAIGMPLEDLLDEIVKYAEEYAPVINSMIYNITEKEIDVLPYVNLATLMLKSYLSNEDFMNQTLGETICGFAEEELTVEAIKEEIAKAVNYLKTNTVYDVLEKVRDINKEGLYETINGVADMLIENYPVYFVINADGELEELSINAVILSEDDDDNKNISILIKKGDLLGDIFTAEEKAEIMSAPTKYTVADFSGYQYAYYHEYVSGGYQSNEVKVIVTVEENEGTYVINREYKYGNYYTIRHSYYFDNADLSDAIITINEDGTIRYDIVRYCYIMESNNSGESGYMEYEEISLVFGENISWLTKDKNYVNDFVALPDAEEVA